MKKSSWIVACTLLAVAACGSFLATRYRADLRTASGRIASGSHVVSTGCGPIEYAETGNGPAVLLVHGAGGGFDQGAELAGQLAAAGFRVIAMSRFGYLRTPLPADASATAQAGAHACLLDALGVQDAAIIGVSAGAPSALAFAARHVRRCTALVLLVPAVYVPRPEGSPSLRTPAATPFLFDSALRSDFLFWLATKVARRTMISSVLATPPEVVATASPQEQQRVGRMLDGILPVAPRRVGLLNDAAVTSSLQREALEQVKAPTLVISLDDDQFGTLDGARYTAGHIPGARFVHFARGGHLWVGHAQEVTGLVVRHLAGRGTS